MAGIGIERGGRVWYGWNRHLSAHNPQWDARTKLSTRLCWTYSGSCSYLTIFHLFYPPPWSASTFPWTKQGGNLLPTTAWRLQIHVKHRAEQETERREGAPLLSRGLRLPIILSTCWQVGCHSVCLATQLPSSPPLQHPITFHPALLRFTRCEKEAPRTSRRTEETKEREDTEEGSGEFGSKTWALIWETLRRQAIKKGWESLNSELWGHVGLGQRASKKDRILA